MNKNTAGSVLDLFLRELCPAGNGAYKLTQNEIQNIREVYTDYPCSIPDRGEAVNILKSSGVSCAVIHRIENLYRLSDFLTKGQQNNLPSISTPRQVYDYFSLRRNPHTEVMYGIFMNIRNEIIRIRTLARGTYNAMACTPADVLSPALKMNARNLILVHNHPSGDPGPSSEDSQFTGRIHDAAKLVGITLLDHIIIGAGKFYSFKQAALL